MFIESYDILKHILKQLVYVNIVFLIMNKTTKITNFVKVYVRIFYGTRELYFNSSSVVGSLSNKIKVNKLTNT